MSCVAPTHDRSLVSLRCVLLDQEIGGADEATTMSETQRYTAARGLSLVVPGPRAGGRAGQVQTPLPRRDADAQAR